jgi:hypothetical protein
LPYLPVPAEHGEGESQEGAMPEHSKERTQAEAKFKKAQRATDGSQAMSEYNAERQAERAKTARLKELRLAKEAAEKVAKQPKPTKKRWSAT